MVEATDLYVQNKADWDKLMEESKKKLVMVDFTASWCPPCQAMKPHVIKVAGDMKNEVIVRMLDVDKNKSIARDEGI